MPLLDMSKITFTRADFHRRWKDTKRRNFTFDRLGLFLSGRRFRMCQDAYNDAFDEQIESI